MSIRKATTNRLRLVRTCYVCGKTFPTTADSPFMRQLSNVDGKKQKTCYFCSETCKNSTYKHLFDGRADIRREEREQARAEQRDRKAENHAYYIANREKLTARSRERWNAMSQSERDAVNWYRRAQRYIRRGGDVKSPQKYQYNGDWYTVSELAELSGICVGTIKNRLYRLNWSVADAVTIPPKVGRNQYTKREELC